MKIKFLYIFLSICSIAYGQTIKSEEILIKKLEPEMDEDGYAVGDPYAEAAKMIDRKKKAEEASKTLKAKAAKTAKYII